VGTTTGPEFCNGQPSWPCSTIPAAITGGPAFAALTGGSLHSCGLTTGGDAYCWGRGDKGQLGNGTFASDSLPVPVGGGLTFSLLTAGSEFTCGLTTIGEVFCWGDDAGGQLGDSGTGTFAVPHRVRGGLTFVTLSTGQYHACALTSSGQAYCWGGNGAGQGGYDPSYGIINNARVPLRVGGGLTFSTITAGGNHTCGITTSGVAYCWGDASHGQLGIGPLTGLDNCSSGPCSLLPKKVTYQR